MVLGTRKCLYLSDEDKEERGEGQSEEIEQSGGRNEDDDEEFQSQDHNVHPALHSVEG